MKKKILLQLLILLCVTTVLPQDIGKASYYGKKFQGRRTSSGEKFDNKAYTAAHRSLPFGTYVRVTSISDNKSVLVKINDRGHFKNRIIDLSYAAAKELDMIRKGIIDVRVEVIPDSLIKINLPTDTVVRDTIKSVF